MREPRLDDFLGDEDIEALFRPTAKAHGLPGRVYFDEAFYDLERRKLFPSSWVAAAFAQDIPEPGDAFPVSIAGWELVFVRTKAGEVRCYHNICRHRGMKLVREPVKGSPTLSCPWHCWTYDLEGKLVATPNIGGVDVGRAEGLDRSELGLIPVRCEQWWNFLFVNIDGEAPPLETHLEPLEERIAAFDLSETACSGLGFEYEFTGNWKILIEGGIEDYHFPWVHPELLPQGAFRPEVGGDCYAGISSRPTELGGVAKMIGKKLGEASRALPKFSHLANLSKIEMCIFLVVPSGIFALNPDHAVTTLFIPKSHDRTVARRLFHFIGEDGARHEDYAEARNNVVSAWSVVTEQDASYIDEAHKMSKVREALGLETRFSPFWEPAVQHFQKMVVERLRD
jgi:choline monooxygenase